jgi:CheY-like chemotaxis protein
MTTKILVVDDRSLNREFLTLLLGFAGYSVVGARDGFEGLERVREERPDLVVIDVVMPNMDGPEFVRRLHADAAFHELPVIFYTATYRLA